MVSSGAMEADEENKKKEPKLSDELVSFIRKRSEREVPRYTARLKSYVDIQAKRRRAAMARHREKTTKNKTDEGQKDKTLDQDQYYNSGVPALEMPRMMCGLSGENLDEIRAKKRGAEKTQKSRSVSRSPSDACCRRRRRRRRSKCRRRRRSCRRRRRSRCRRKRRRSCRRRARRRRRSCRKRRRRCGR